MPVELLKSTYHFTISQGEFQIKKKYKATFERQAWDKLDNWLVNHPEYNEWKVQFWGCSSDKKI